MKLENKIKKMFLIIVMLLITIVAVGCNDDKPIIPDPTPEKDVLTNFMVITSEPIIKEKVEFALYGTSTNYIQDNFNPYDYTQINVYAEITAPDESIIKVYGFWYRDYEITINENYKGTISGVSGTASTDPNEIQGLEQVKWKSDTYHFRFRFTPTVSGLHKVTVKVEEKGELVQTIQNNILINDNNSSNYLGIINVDSSNNRHFIDSNGETFIPTGINLCWWSNSNRKTYDYDVWFENLSTNGGNFARIWMATWGFCQHWSSIDNYNSSQNMAARLDRVMEVAEEYNIYIQLCLLNHGQFSTVANSEWDNNPYNEKNGGMLSSPAQFFRDEDAKRIYKMELRYLVARYGYADNLMAWELFNEVDWTDGAESYNMINIRNWHKEMATFIKDNDPYNHMITTSYKYINSSWQLAFNLDEIDFASVHSYEFTNKNINATLPEQIKTVMNKYNKPIQIGEIGIDWESGYKSASIDPDGDSIRQALWAGMMCGSVSGAMQWWWESWIHPSNLWYLFKGVGSYAEMLDLTGDNYQLLSSDNYTLNNQTAGLLGYHFDNRIYGYVYNTKWAYYTSNTNDITNLVIETSLTNGSYEITYYNTINGNVILKDTLTVTNNKCQFTLPTFNEDIAFIIK